MRHTEKQLDPIETNGSSFKAPFPGIRMHQDGRAGGWGGGEIRFADLALEVGNATDDASQGEFERTLRAAVDKRIADIIHDEDAFEAYSYGLRHGNIIPSLADRELRDEVDFRNDLPEWLNRLIEVRIKTTQLRDQVMQLNDRDESELHKSALFYYRTARDLWGPLMNGFAANLRKMCKSGKLTHNIIGLRRDFEIVSLVMRKHGISEKPAFLTRRLSMNSDVFDESSETALTSEDIKRHLSNMALYMKQIRLTTDEDIAILDTGAWGTLAAEWILLRSALSSLSSNQHKDLLRNISPENRLYVALQLLPPSITQAMETVTDPDFNTDAMPQQTRRKLLWQMVLADDDVIDGLDGRTFKTTAIDLFSHQYDKQYRDLPQRKIASWLHHIAPQVSDTHLMQLNDTFELWPKRWQGPTHFVRTHGGIVDVDLTPTPLVQDFAANGARKGAADSFDIWQHRDTHNICIHPEKTINHMIHLIDESLQTDRWTGILPTHTPTWTKGEYFIREAWPKMVEFPESTYYETDLDALDA